MVMPFPGHHHQESISMPLLIHRSRHCDKMCQPGVLSQLLDVSVLLVDIKFYSFGSNPGSVAVLEIAPGW